MLKEHKLIVSQWVGVTDDRMFIAYYRNLCALDERAVQFTELIDLRQAQGSLGITVNGLMQVGKIVAATYAKQPAVAHVVVIAPTYLTFGLARMYQGLASPEFINFRVFRTGSEAAQALSISQALMAEVDGLQPASERFLPLGRTEEIERSAGVAR